ncbi:S-adenosyl-L-methionine-dependent methyltransferase [Kalaharituber pfeilii]|nr:S-adenosyl-L-methionine-dependent methyltransferase [Kalaharituber pfeilii]
MATFAKSNFGFSAYVRYRPEYPPSLFSYLLKYHSPAPLTTYLDLGCGPGTVTGPLSTHFQRTYAVDPSRGMLDLARTNLSTLNSKKNITFHLSPAESLPFISTSSISLTTAAQAAHWFQPIPLWPELARCTLRAQSSASPLSGGTVSFWGYTDCVLPSHPRATFVLNDYAYSDSHWGPYWSQPGRSRVQNRLRALRPPNDGRWTAVERWEYEPAFTHEATATTGFVWPRTVQKETPEEEAQYAAAREGGREGDGGIFGKLVKGGEKMLAKKMTLADLEDYIRTWSSVHGWNEAHPGAKRQQDGGTGDSVDECFAEMARVENNWGLPAEEDWSNIEVHVEWGHGMITMKRTDKE